MYIGVMTWELSPFGSHYGQRFAAYQKKWFKEQMQALQQTLNEERTNALKEVENNFEDKVKDLDQQMQIQNEKHEEALANQKEKVIESVRKGMEKIVDTLGENDFQEFSNTSQDYTNIDDTTPPKSVDNDVSLYKQVQAKAVKSNSGGKKGRAVGPGGRGSNRKASRDSDKTGLGGENISKLRGSTGSAGPVIGLGGRESGRQSLGAICPDGRGSSRKNLSGKGKRGMTGGKGFLRSTRLRGGGVARSGLAIGSSGKVKEMQLQKNEKGTRITGG